MASRNLYALEFTEPQWAEIEAMGHAFFKIEIGQHLTRPQWVALGQMLLGKAQRIDEGAYDIEPWVRKEDPHWAEELRAIAAIIFDCFRPVTWRTNGKT